MDSAIFKLINGFAGRWPLLDSFAKFCAEYLIFITVLAVVLMALLMIKEVSEYAKQAAWAVWAVGTAVVARFVVAEIIKRAVARPRPAEVIAGVNQLIPLSADAAGRSFPSGHTTFMVALASAVWPHNKKLAIACFFAAALTGISRIFVGLHWPSDILAGAVVGYMIAGPVLSLVKREINKRFADV